MFDYKHFNVSKQIIVNFHINSVTVSVATYKRDLRKILNECARLDTDYEGDLNSLIAKRAKNLKL